MADETNYDFSSLIGEECSIISQLDENAPLGDLVKTMACQINLLQVALQNSVFPAGKLIWHLGCRSKINSGFIIADGSWYSTTTYPALFENIGYKYGIRLESDQSNSFRVPDLRGVSVKGMDLGANCIKDIADYEGMDNEGTQIFGDNVGAVKKYGDDAESYTMVGNVRKEMIALPLICLLYTSPSPRDA